MTMAWTAAAEDVGARLDVFVQERVPEFSRTRVQALVRDGSVTANDRKRPPGHRLREGEVVRLVAEPPEPEAAAPGPEPIGLEVVYEDDALLIVNKPPGLVVHPAPGHEAGTLINALLHRGGERIRDVGGENRCGILHRLDKDTSGLLIAAKTDAAHAKLKADLADRRIVRRYIGITMHQFRQTEGEIDRPLGRMPSDRKRMAVVEDGRPARTTFHVITQTGNVALVSLGLHTGRTHQIRVHLKAIGRPIMGDPVYGFTKQRSMMKLAAHLRSSIGPIFPRRQMLHAAGLAFVHPGTAARIERCASPPADMSRLVSEIFSVSPEALMERVGADLAGAELSDDAFAAREDSVVLPAPGGDRFHAGDEDIE